MASFDLSHTRHRKASSALTYLSCSGCMGASSAAMLSCDGCGGKCGGPGSGATRFFNADFNEAQAKVKRAEGGYSNDPRDKGNYTGNKIGVGRLIGTNWGIAAPTLKAYLGYEPSVQEMKSLPYATAVKIYKAQYWNPIKGDQIKSQKLADMIYDSAVNQGVGRATSYVKDSLDTKTYDISKINAANPDQLFNKIGAKRKADYIALGGYAKQSWLNRLKDLGYAIEKNKGKTAMIIFGLGLAVTGIVMYKRQTAQ